MSRKRGKDLFLEEFQLINENLHSAFSRQGGQETTVLGTNLANTCFYK